MNLGVSGQVHRTWAHTFACHPALTFKPESVEDVQAIVGEARKLKKNVVTVGAGHSPSIITMTSDWVLSLDNLNKVLDVDQQKDFCDVYVECGLRLKDLNNILAEMGLALQNLGSISEQSVAGVISTGTHGSSCVHGLISEQIVSLDLVLEDGNIVTCSDSENSDLFSAVLLGLGAFGVLVRARVRCVPAFNIESQAYVLEFDDLLDSKIWNRVFLDSEFHRIWWYPYSDKVYLWRGDRTTKLAEKPAYSFYGTKLGRLLYELLLWVSVKLSPKLTPAVEKWLFSHQFKENVITTHVGRSDNEINMDCLFKQYVNEWSLPLTNGPEMLKELRDEIRSASFYVHAPIEIRASNTTLPTTFSGPNGFPGPVYGNLTRPLLDPSPKLQYKEPGQVTNEQLTMNLNATMYKPFGCIPDIASWFATFETLCAKYGGKPHWAKNFVINPWVWPENRANVDKWKQLRKQHAPNHMFGGQEWLMSKGLL